ncbi:hypothetical protein J6590_107651, partial [Homalodisca vitripennis]
MSVQGLYLSPDVIKQLRFVFCVTLCNSPCPDIADKSECWCFFRAGKQISTEDA